MPKIENLISYYINGVLISSSKLKQPPDLLSNESLATALGIVINAHINGQTKIKQGVVRVTQGTTVIKEYIYEPP